MRSEPNGGKQKPQRGSMMALGIARGAGLGAALGVTFDNLALGIAIGMGTGITLEAADASEEDAGPRARIASSVDSAKG
jgi:uncharacterized membrane protein